MWLNRGKKKTNLSAELQFAVRRLVDFRNARLLPSPLWLSFAHQTHTELCDIRHHFIIVPHLTNPPTNFFLQSHTHTHTCPFSSSQRHRARFFVGKAAASPKAFDTVTTRNNATPRQSSTFLVATLSVSRFADLPTLASYTTRIRSQQAASCKLPNIYYDQLQLLASPLLSSPSLLSDLSQHYPPRTDRDQPRL